MKQNMFRQPMFVQKKWDYREYLLEEWTGCYCYEMTPTDAFVYIPDGGWDFLWNIDRKELCCLDCAVQVRTIEWVGDRLFGIHISPFYECDYEMQKLKEWMEHGNVKLSFQERALRCSRQLRQNIRMKEVHSLIRYSVEQIIKSKGGLAVEELAAGTDYSSRQMEHLFRKQFECGPKRLSQYVRLHYAVSYIVQEPGQSFAVIAEQLGYSDQSHFQREFKRFMGLTPKQFVMRYL